MFQEISGGLTDFVRLLRRLCELPRRWRSNNKEDKVQHGLSLTLGARSRRRGNLRRSSVLLHPNKPLRGMFGFRNAALRIRFRWGSLFRFVQHRLLRVLVFKLHKGNNSDLPSKLKLVILVRLTRRRHSSEVLFRILNPKVTCLRRIRPWLLSLESKS